MPRRSSRRDPRRWAVALVSLLLLVLAIGVPRAPVLVAPATEERTSRDVYWVGHSLFGHEDRLATPARNVIDVVDYVSSRRGVHYTGDDQVFAGAPMALNWTGELVAGGRTPVPEAAQMRESFSAHADRYDALVITEAVPFDHTTRNERSAFYLRAFYCAFYEQGDEDADRTVYLYEGWPHLQATDPQGGYPDPWRWDWRRRIRVNHPRWIQLADDALRTPPPVRDLWGRFVTRLASIDACAPRRPIAVIPAGTALAEAVARIRAGSGPSGLREAMLFQNAYVDWPEHWPIARTKPAPADAEETVRSRTPTYPDEKVDDIHASRVGSYLLGLLAWAVLYRQDPHGTPPPSYVPEAWGRFFEDVVWDVVCATPRTDVRCVR